MTNHDVNTFAASLVEMALATKRLPEAEQELSEANRRIDGYLATIQRLELKLIARANEIDTLKAQVRAAEVARDDAELRFLECDDAKSTLERTLETIIGEARGVLAAVRPSVPQPPVPVAEEVKLVESPLSESVGHTEATSSGQTEAGNTSPDPLAPVAPSNPEASTAESPTAPSVEGSADAGQGESAADPTVASPSNPVNANPDGANISEAVHATADEGPHPGPFASSSSSEQSSTAGGGVESAGNASSPDPEPTKHDDHGFIRHEWWMWHDRKLGLAS